MTHPPAFDQLVVRGRALYDLGRYEQAAALFEQALAERPGAYWATRMIAVCRLQDGEREETKKAIEGFLSIAPNDSYAFYLAAFFYQKSHELKQAEEAIHRAVQINPGVAAYFGKWSMILRQQHRWHESIQKANEGLTIDPQNSDCLRNRVIGQAHLGLDFQADAISLLGVDPDDTYAHEDVGSANLINGEIDLAYFHLREALRIQPDNVETRQQLIEALKAHHPFFRFFLRMRLRQPDAGVSPTRQQRVRLGITQGLIGSSGLVGAAIAKEPLIYHWFTHGVGLVIAGTLVLSLYLLLALEPLSNLFFLTHPFARYVLTTHEKRTALFAGAGLFLLLSLVWLLAR